MELCPTLLDKWVLVRAVAFDPNSSRGDIATIIALLDLLSPEGEAWPSIDTIAAKTKQSPRNALRCITKQVETGRLLPCSRRGRGNLNRYRPKFCNSDAGVGSPAASSDAGVGSPAASSDAGVGSPAASSDAGVGSPAASSDAGVGLVRTPASDNPSYLFLKETNTPRRHRRSHVDERLIDEHFRRLWSVFPLRDGDNPRKPAREAFAALMRRGVDVEVIIAAAMRYAAETADLANRKYIAQAVTWLRQERFADMAPAPPSVGTSPAAPTEHQLGEPGDRLLKLVGAHAFRHWLAGLTVDRVGIDTVYLKAPSGNTRMRVQTEFSDLIAKCWGVGRAEIIL